jgi:hypothetical protein
MKVYFKIKFGSSQNKIESFGAGRYLVYMTLKKEDSGAMSTMLSLISKKLCAEPKNIKYLGKRGEGNLEEHIFDI